MVSQAFADVEARHRLLEGFLLRLARDPEADAFALRGGMLVRHWFPSLGRTVRDVDLICRMPFDRDDLRIHLARILADQTVDDGVWFEPDRFRLDVLRPDDHHPGLRLFAAGTADGSFGEMSIDMTFNLEVWPAAERGALRAERGDAELWLCRPEMLIGRKLVVTAELGRRYWRPKDLTDIWWMLQRFAPAPEVLAEAVERSFFSQPVPQLSDLFTHTSWWHDHSAMSRWNQHLRQSPGLSAPRELSPVVEEVRSYMASVI